MGRDAGAGARAAGMVKDGRTGAKREQAEPDTGRPHGSSLVAMRTLYHFPLSPVSRAVRVALAEKGLEFTPVLEKPWERREEFQRLNPAGEVPVLIDEHGTAVVGGTILEYLEEVYPEPSLLAGTAAERAEIRRLTEWFLHKFAIEVTDNLVGEKYIKRLSGQGYPQANTIRAGLANIHYHLDYIAFLAERRTWLAGDRFSLADVMAGTQLSTLDYINAVPWGEHVDAKDWYARIKSRPSFRSLLMDLVQGIPPPAHYGDLDF